MIKMTSWIKEEDNKEFLDIVFDDGKVSFPIERINRNEYMDYEHPYMKKVIELNQIEHYNWNTNGYEAHYEIEIFQYLNNYYSVLFNMSYDERRIIQIKKLS